MPITNSKTSIIVRHVGPFKRLL